MYDQAVISDLFGNTNTNVHWIADDSSVCRESDNDYYPDTAAIANETMSVENDPVRQNVLTKYFGNMDNFFHVCDGRFEWENPTQNRSKIIYRPGPNDQKWKKENTLEVNRFHSNFFNSLDFFDGKGSIVRVNSLH